MVKCTNPYYLDPSCVILIHMYLLGGILIHMCLLGGILIHMYLLGKCQDSKRIHLLLSVRGQLSFFTLFALVTDFNIHY